jgi:hypothetical protein
MACLAAQRCGVFVGAILTGAFGCGPEAGVAAADLDDYGSESRPLELGTKPEPLVMPAEDSAAGAVVCASDIVEPTAVPMNLYLMIDRSGSMQESDKWGQGMAALRQFVEDPAARGLRIALRFFGDAEPVEGCSQQECSMDACAQPLVPIGALLTESGAADGHETALVRTLEQTQPLNGFGTPIYPALGGALQWAREYRGSHVNEKVAVVFVTDGEPNGCDTSIDRIATLASDAFADSGIRTYAIGLEGANHEQMNQIAAAGATATGIFIGESTKAEQMLLQALNDIRRQSTSCDFLLPEPDPGKVADIQTVNLVRQTAEREAKLYKVDGLDRCAGDALGWYFDDPVHPSRIHLCPNTCEASNADPETRLSVVMGCVETRRRPSDVR